MRRALRDEPEQIVRVVLDRTLTPALVRVVAGTLRYRLAHPTTVGGVQPWRARSWSTRSASSSSSSVRLRRSSSMSQCVLPVALVRGEFSARA